MGPSALLAVSHADVDTGPVAHYVVTDSYDLVDVWCSIRCTMLPTAHDGQPIFAHDMTTAGVTPDIFRRYCPLLFANVGHLRLLRC